MTLLTNAISRALRVAAMALLCLSLLACSDDTTTTPGNDTGGLDGGDNTGGDDQAGGDDNSGAGSGDDTNDKPTANVSGGDSLAPTERVRVTFSEPMNPGSLELGGTLVGNAGTRWVSAEVLELAPNGYWPPGSQTLVVNASDGDGLAMDTLQQHVEVESPFTTFQAAAVVIGQQDFITGDSRQSPDAPSAAPNTLDLPGSAVAYAAEKDILFISDTYDSRVLGFDGIPDANNANADFVIGQPDFWSSVGETSRSRMRLPQGISARGGKLIVGDPDSHRLLVYDEVPEGGPVDASVVIGQPDFDSIENGCGPNDINHSHGHFVTPSGRLLVADGVNNRVLVWNAIPARIGEAPDLVIGQSGFDLCAANDDNQNGVNDTNEQLATARTLQHPTGVWSDDERLVVVDNYNNRVLIWNTFPTENFVPADIVLGQGDMRSLAANDDNQDGVADAAPSARVLNYPWSVWVEQQQLFVADENNSRVLIWNDWPQEDFAPADVVIGQSAFDSALPNDGNAAPTASTLNVPKGVRVIGGKLLVTDTGNSRVLVFEAG